jgi:zinc protease
MTVSMSLRRWLVVVVVVLVGSGCARGGDPPLVRATPGGGNPAPAAGAVAPTREVLPNGVVLIGHDHRASDVVALQLWVRVGGRDEAPEELGLSHYLEHMLFKGTPTRPPGSIDRLVEGLGGRSNAFTSYDFTHYDVVVPAAHVVTGLELLADIAVNASFPVDELEREKQVVFEEMRLSQDDPELFLSRRLSEVTYAGHPYGRPILGTRDLVASLTRERLDAFYRKHYVPANMVLVVVGPVPHAELRPLVDRTFARLQGPAPPPRAAAPVPPLAERRAEDVRRPERQAYLGLAWQAAAMASEDVFAVDLLTYILGDGPASRLNQVVREQRGLVAAIEASFIARERSGFVSVKSRLEAGRLAEAERAVLEVVRGIREEGVTAAERERALVTAESFYAFDIETAEGLARSYGQAETTWTLADELAYLDRLRAVTAAEIQAAARKYFREEAYARVRFLPVGGSR